MDSLHQLGPPPMAPMQPLGPPPISPAQAIGPPTMAPTQTLGPPPISQPRDGGSPPGVEEQEDSLGLEELCKPLYCKLCNVTLNSAQQAQAHYQGKNHGKKLRNFYAGSQQPPATRIPEVLDAAGQTCISVPCVQALYKGATRVILATENDYCKLCDASFSSPAVAQAHYQGKNHAKKLRLAEALQNSNNHMEGNNEAAPRRNRKDGTTNFLSPAPHPPTPGPYYNPRPRQRIPRDLAMCVTPSGQFYCSMCNCGAEQETDFRQHLESKQHKAKVSELRYRHEMENLGYKSSGRSCFRPQPTSYLLTGPFGGCQAKGLSPRPWLRPCLQGERGYGDSTLG
uniref:Zinc finger matrin-type protein 3 n=1 Tax=Scophthalmus maximus TaxID=52904 RepID=A0A8D3D2W7_SCOMX